MSDNYFKEILSVAVKNRASDIHLSSDKIPMLRIYGELRQAGSMPLSGSYMIEQLSAIMQIDLGNILENQNEIDFAVDIPGISRFRLNIFKHFFGIGAAFRVIPQKIPSLDELNLPVILKKFMMVSQGLILVTGSTGSGKSTTLTAMVNDVNHTYRKHIITIEDPIEYIHIPDKSIIHQREIEKHTENYSDALHGALREDPDIIQVGELRSPETIEQTLHAAETGHLILSTMHTQSAPDTIDRIINVFSPGQQEQVRMVLSQILVAIICQKLLKMADGSGLAPVLEILVANTATRNLIRERKTHQIHSVMQTSASDGMKTFEQSMKEFAGQGLFIPTSNTMLTG
jgi:twitching motility protein PilT